MLVKLTYIFYQVGIRCNFDAQLITFPAYQSAYQLTDDLLVCLRI